MDDYAYRVNHHLILLMHISDMSFLVRSGSPASIHSLAARVRTPTDCLGLSNILEVAVVVKVRLRRSREPCS